MKKDTFVIAAIQASPVFIDLDATNYRKTS